MSAIANLCQFCTDNHTFWVIVAAFTLLEPILCSKWPTPFILGAQKVGLAISTVLFVIQVVGIISSEWEKILKLRAVYIELDIPVTFEHLTSLKVIRFLISEGEYSLELVCLMLGWVLIFVHPGLAILRCFRVFRLLWFYKIEVFRRETERYMNPFLGKEFVDNMFQLMKFLVKALSALGNEMFRLTEDTRGGLFVIMLFFYFAYVLSLALWIETADETISCGGLGSCMYMLVRLSLFDTNGFDFAYELTQSHRFLFVMVMGYMCISAFGIIYGLTGIFGSAFAFASEIAFAEGQEEQQQQEAQQQQAQHEEGDHLGSEGNDTNYHNGEINEGADEPRKEDEDEMLKGGDDGVHPFTDQDALFIQQEPSHLSLESIESASSFAQQPHQQLAIETPVASAQYSYPTAYSAAKLRQRGDSDDSQLKSPASETDVRAELHNQSFLKLPAYNKTHQASFFGGTPNRLQSRGGLFQSGHRVEASPMKPPPMLGRDTSAKLGISTKMLNTLGGKELARTESKLMKSSANLFGSSHPMSPDNPMLETPSRQRHRPMAPSRNMFAGSGENARRHPRSSNPLASNSLENEKMAVLAGMLHISTKLEQQEEMILEINHDMLQLQLALQAISTAKSSMAVEELEGSGDD